MERKERYRKPQTIDELRQFCAEKGMPLERMRFFIGEDYRGARAFGIYEAEDGDFVVYKNKANGERAVRYKGPNEAYAVNELYEKLKSETEQRREQRPASAPRSAMRQGAPTRSTPPRKRLKKRWIVTAAAVLLVGGISIAVARTPNRGYYQYEGRGYYYDYDYWYAYDEYNDDWYWIEDVDPTLERHYGDYYLSEDYDDVYGVGDFRDSAYYDYNSGYSSYYDDSDYDSYYSDSDDYDWDYDYDTYDSWDDYDTDWDSDW